jgi:hypothetical protein
VFLSFSRHRWYCGCRGRGHVDRVEEKRQAIVWWLAIEAINKSNKDVQGPEGKQVNCIERFSISDPYLTTRRGANRRESDHLPELRDAVHVDRGLRAAILGHVVHVHEVQDKHPDLIFFFSSIYHVFH